MSALAAMRLLQRFMLYETAIRLADALCLSRREDIAYG